MESQANQPDDESLVAGARALMAGEWETARDFYETALAQEETPQALEGLGMAAQWLDDAVTTFDARLRAFRLYNDCKDARSAGRIATLLAYDYFTFRGEPAVACGWLQRAQRLLSNLEPGFEQGLLLVIQGHFAVMLDHDCVAAEAFGAGAEQLGRELELFDLEAMGAATKGLARVSAGQVAHGMSILDGCAAAAVSGEVGDPDAQTIICCYLIRACEYVCDYVRAGQWCDHLKVIGARWNYRMLFPYCRIHYACLLVWRGDWPEAESTIIASIDSLMGVHPAEAAIGLVRMAELRRRQGRFEEATAFLDQAEMPPFHMKGAAPALLVRAAVAWDTGDAAGAKSHCERFLRRVPRENRMERTCALMLMTIACAALGLTDEAREAHGQLENIADTVATAPLRAMANAAAGHMAYAEGDYTHAAMLFEDAVDLFAQSDGAFDTICARIGLAQALFAMGRVKQAAVQAKLAHDHGRSLGAVHYAQRAWTLLQESRAYENTLRPARTNPDALTARELEVLQKMAAGHSNQEIADALVLSVRTVERHISNIYDKLGLHGKAARGAVVSYAHVRNLLRTP